jgi:hypothetical protein
MWQDFLVTAVSSIPAIGYVTYQTLGDGGCCDHIAPAVSLVGTRFMMISALPSQAFLV